MSTTKILDRCRACGSKAISKYYDFGKMPLSNNLTPTKWQAIESDKYPMELYRCSTCNMSQLSVVIPPESLYSYYTYRSGMSIAYRKHCKDLAELIKIGGYIKERSIALDIAGNDGTLLSEFRKILDIMPLCVDPAENLLKHAQDNGCAIHKAFWNYDTASRLKESEIRANRFIDGAMIITATNVYAHVDDVDDFMKGIKYYLHPKGVSIIEFPHVLDFIERCEFDTTYFEHLSYMSLQAFKIVAERHGLSVFRVNKLNIHGGSLQIWCCHNGMYDIEDNVNEILEKESVLNNGSMYLQFHDIVKTKISLLESALSNMKTWNRKYIGFGASAKGNILLNCINPYLLPEYIIDETPEKIGKYSPGIGLEIKSLAGENFNDIDVVVILAWNFKDEMEKKLRISGFKGEIYCPL